MSKGSQPRPIEIPREEYAARWDQIFRPAKPPKEKPPCPPKNSDK